MVKAIACEMVYETKRPLSRQSLADVTDRAGAAVAKPISRSTVWRILDADAIKPWQYKYWIFPRDPQCADKAGVILDLYAGVWQGDALGAHDYILSADEKTSIQARHRGARGASSTSTSAAVPCHIWRPGMCNAALSWDVASLGRVLNPLAAW